MSDKPIVLGIAGLAGTGKTALANELDPLGGIMMANPSHNPGSIDWNHLYFALPLYSLAAIRRVTEGAKALDRIKYSTHQVLLDIFGNSPLFGAPPYSRLIEMVDEIVSLPFPMDDMEKPRDFLQHSADIIKGYDPEIIVKWMKRKVISEVSRVLREFDESDELYVGKKRVGIVISDVRYQREAEFIKSYDDSVLIKLIASDEVRAARIEDRDGVKMTTEQLQHNSETALDDIDPMLYDHQLDTTHMTVDDEVRIAMNVIKDRVLTDA